MNKSKLEEVMNQKKISKAAMCKELGISRSAFYRKCEGISEFTLAEIQKMVDILNLSSPMGVFFDAKVS